MRKNPKAKSAVKAFDLSKVDPQKKEEAIRLQELFDSGITDMKVCAEKLGVNTRYLYSNLDLYAVINGKADKHEAYGIRKYNRKPSKVKSRSKKANKNASKNVISEEEISKNVISKEVTVEETTSEETVAEKATVNIPEKTISVEDLLNSTIESANKLIELIEGNVLEFDKKVNNPMKEENIYEW